MPTQGPEMRRFWQATLPTLQERLADLGIKLSHSYCWDALAVLVFQTLACSAQIRS